MCCSGRNDIIVVCWKAKHFGNTHTVAISMCLHPHESRPGLHAITHMTDYQASGPAAVNQSHLRRSKASAVQIIETYARIIAN